MISPVQFQIIKYIKIVFANFLACAFESKHYCEKMKQCFIWVCHMCSNSAEVCFIFRVLFGYTEQL